MSAIEGNRVKDSSGATHSMTLTKPVARDSQSTDIRVRLYGSTQTEDRKREQFRKYAETLRTLLAQNGAMWTSVAVTEMKKTDPDFQKTLGKTKFKSFLELFPDMFKLQTSSSGGASKVMLVRS